MFSNSNIIALALIALTLSSCSTVSLTVEINSAPTPVVAVETQPTLQVEQVEEYYHDDYQIYFCFNAKQGAKVITKYTNPEGTIATNPTRLDEKGCTFVQVDYGTPVVTVKIDGDDQSEPSVARLYEGPELDLAGWGEDGVRVYLP